MNKWLTPTNYIRFFFLINLNEYEIHPNHYPFILLLFFFSLFYDFTTFHVKLYIVFIWFFSLRNWTRVILFVMWSFLYVICFYSIFSFYFMFFFLCSTISLLFHVNVDYSSFSFSIPSRFKPLSLLKMLISYIFFSNRGVCYGDVARHRQQP